MLISTSRMLNRFNEVDMKNNAFGFRVGRVLAAIGCLLLAIMVWLVVRYGQIGDIPVIPLG